MYAQALLADPGHHFHLTGKLLQLDQRISLACLLYDGYVTVLMPHLAMRTRWYGCTMMNGSSQMQ